MRNFLVAEGLSDRYDLITIPGASLGVEKIVRIISTSIHLHEPNEIWIFDHEDCGAYGKNNSTKAHINNLKKARRFLAENYPSKKVRTFIAGFNIIKEVF